jgi:Xaa-Pro aminopeptidase
MVMSNEPGYYADGKFGVRIENIDVIKMAETRENFGNKGYLGLEHVTMVSRYQVTPARADILP